MEDVSESKRMAAYSWLELGGGWALFYTDREKATSKGFHSAPNDKKYAKVFENFHHNKSQFQFSNSKRSMAGWRDLVRGVNKAKKSHPIPIAYFGVWDIHMLNITFTRNPLQMMRLLMMKRRK